MVNLLTSCRNRHVPLIITGTMLFLLNSAFAQTPFTHSDNSSTASSAIPTVYLDFDGHRVTATSWNMDGDIDAKPAGLSAAIVQEIIKRVSEDFAIFNLLITTDSTKFHQAPVLKRMRIIVTPTNEWYGHSGGAAFINSFNWGNDTPAFVFSNVLEENAKYIGEATSHEIGHTLGLQHQSLYDDNCNLLYEYAEGQGDGEIGWAPIMGVGYYKNTTTWTTGTTIEGCDVIQKDVEILSGGIHQIGLRADDHGDVINNATVVAYTGTNFRTTGVINSSSDKDHFKLVFTSTTILQLEVNPVHVNSPFDGANVDLKMTLMNASGTVIGSYNPRQSLGVLIDTNLAKGTYYLQVHGVANENMSNYGSLGSYVFRGAMQAVLPLVQVELKGKVAGIMHHINWTLRSEESIAGLVLESSTNGSTYSALASLTPRVAKHLVRSKVRSITYYRLKMITADGEEHLSNVITLQTLVPGGVKLVGNVVRSYAVVSVDDGFSYQLTDMNGKYFGGGPLSAGFNTIPMDRFSRGVFLLRVYNELEQSTFRVIKQ